MARPVLDEGRIAFRPARDQRRFRRPALHANLAAPQRRRFAMQRLVLLLTLALVSSAARAESTTMSWLMTNAHPRAVVVELVSQSRDHRWPGSGQVYLIELGERKSVPIECEGGEKICYAAWVNGNDRVSWGIGPDGTGACEDCCSLCATSATQEIVVGE
jgi:hypothetical protein